MPPRPDPHRREQLLDALEYLVLQEGFEHLRVGMLADRLHCSRSTLYKLAPSKEELMTLVFERFADRAIDDAVAQANELEDPAAKIIRYSDVVDVHQSKGSVRFWRDVAAHPAVSDSLSESRARGYRIVVGFLEEGIASGHFRPLNTAWVGHLIWLCARQTREPDVLARLGVDRATANRELIELIVNGVHAPGR